MERIFCPERAKNPLTRNVGANDNDMNRSLGTIIAAVLLTLAVLSLSFDAHWLFLLLFIAGCLAGVDWTQKSADSPAIVRHAGWFIGIAAVVFSQRLGRLHEEEGQAIAAAVSSILKDPVIVLCLLLLLWLRTAGTLMTIRRKNMAPTTASSLPPTSGGS